MSETQIAAQEIDGAGPGFSWVDILIILVKYKKLIVGLPLAVVLVVTPIGFFLPGSYRANTQLLPPQQARSSSAALLSNFGGAAAAVLGASTIKSFNELYTGMLKSRTIADKLIEKYDLLSVYGTTSPGAARSQLAKNTSIETRKDGLITIEVEDEDRQRAAQLANAYVEELLQLAKVLAVTEASQRRMFLERQLNIAKENLSSAEAKFEGVIDARGNIKIDTEDSAQLRTIERLEAEISAKEIQLSAMRAFVSARNQDYRQGQEELNSLRAQLSKLQNGRPEAGSDTQPGSTGKPGLDDIKIVRDIKYYQMLYGLLAQQYEEARLDEGQDGALIQVLDAAIVPEVRTWNPIPVVVPALLALILALGAVCFLEAKDRLRAKLAGESKWREFKSRMRGVKPRG